MRGFRSFRVLRHVAALPTATWLFSSSAYASGPVPLAKVPARAGIHIRSLSSDGVPEATTSPDSASSTPRDPSNDHNGSRSALMESHSNRGVYEQERPVLSGQVTMMVEEGSVALGHGKIHDEEPLEPGYMVPQVLATKGMVADDTSDDKAPPLVLRDWWLPPIPDWVPRRDPGLHSTWQHYDPENSGRMSAWNYVTRDHPNDSLYLFGEAGSSLVDAFPQLFDDMRSRGWIFYYPLTAHDLVVDEQGRLYIADGVILRLGTKFTHSKAPPLVPRDWWLRPIPDWVPRRLPGLHSTWQHYDPENKRRMSAWEYVTNNHPIESVHLFGETWRTEVTTKAGISLIAAVPEFFDDMRRRGWTFYHPLTADDLMVDEQGKLHIADGVILRLGTDFSHSLAIIFGADALRSLLFDWSPWPLRSPAEVVDFLNLMRSPQLQPEFLMFIHDAGVPQHLRGPFFMRIFDFVMHGVAEELQDELIESLSRVATRWGYGVQENLLLRNHYFYKNSLYNPDDPKDGMYFRRVGECHMLGFSRTFALYGFDYTREQQQLLLHCKCGMFGSQVQKFLWTVDQRKNGRNLLKALKLEEFFCQSGFCCPRGVCMRQECFDRERMHTRSSEDPGVKAIFRVANMIRTNTVNESFITKLDGWQEFENNSYHRPNVPPQFDLVSRDYYPKYSDVYELTAKAGDLVEILYEPENHVSVKRFGKRYCYVKDSANRVGFIHVKFLKKYQFLLGKGRRGEW